jgi:predicted nuclease of predicted toxin-antitoxin system
MSVKLYMDENVPRQITLGLRLRGLDVLTVQEDSRLGLPDPQVLDRATELQRVLFSRDDDLLVIANQRQHNGTPFYGVIYAHPQGSSIGNCVHDLELRAL